MTRSRRRALIGPLVLGLVGTAVLIGLSVWQIQRLGWKEGLIARIEARLEAPPRPVPANPDPQAHAFLSVRAEGELAGAPAHVLTTRRPFGPGYRVIAPVRLSDGRRVMADLGFIDEDEKGEVLPAPGSPVSLTGALFWPEQAGSTPPPEDDLFFSRHVPLLADRLDARPVLIVADRHSLGPVPRAERLGADLPNNHLNYAITWGALAVVWAVMSALWARRRLADAR